MAINLSPLTQNAIQKQKENNQTIDPVKAQEPAQNKKIDKKKLACGIAAAAGVAVLMGTLIHFSKKPRINEFEQGVKKFFNNDGLIEGIKLEKGKALNQDGSGFSGVMKTMTKNGNKVTLEYTDGYLTKSTKNDKLFKTFENITQQEKTLPRNQATRITKFNENGEISKITEQSFYSNGKIKRTATNNSAFDFFENGKIKAKETRRFWNVENPKTLDDFSSFQGAKIYDEQGNLIKEINDLGPNGKAIEYKPNGDKIVLSNIQNLTSKNALSEADDINLDCNKITFYKKQNDKHIKTKEIKRESSPLGEIYKVSDFELQDQKAMLKNSCIIQPNKINITFDNDYSCLLDKNGRFLVSVEDEMISDLDKKQEFFTKFKSYVEQILNETKEQNLFNHDEVEKSANELLAQAKI